MGETLGKVYKALFEAGLEPPVAICSCSSTMLRKISEYIMGGYKNGVITEKRLADALRRILGLKAKLWLRDREFPDKEDLSVSGREASAGII